MTLKKNERREGGEKYSNTSLAVALVDPGS
jgi:hypothetical protein